MSETTNVGMTISDGEKEQVAWLLKRIAGKNGAIDFESILPLPRQLPEARQGEENWAMWGCSSNAFEIEKRESKDTAETHISFQVKNGHLEPVIFALMLLAKHEALTLHVDTQVECEVRRLEYYSSDFPEPYYGDESKSLWQELIREETPEWSEDQRERFHHFIDDEIKPNIPLSQAGKRMAQEVAKEGKGVGK